jgi:hypothetical protein
MMEILKKHGIPTASATLIVLAITFVPLYYQYKTTVSQNARILVLEAQVAAMKK